MPKRGKSPEKNTPRPQPATSVISVVHLRAMTGVAIIILAAFIVYLPSLRGGFILDDNKLLTDNELIKASDGLYRFWCTTEPADYWPVDQYHILD